MRALQQLSIYVTIPSQPHATFVVMSAVNSTAGGQLQPLNVNSTSAGAALRRAAAASSLVVAALPLHVLASHCLRMAWLTCSSSANAVANCTGKRPSRV